MATQALYGARGSCDVLVYQAKHGDEQQQISALKNMRPLFAKHIMLATENRNRQLFAKTTTVDGAAVDVIFKLAIADTKPAVRTAAMETLRIIDKNREKDESVPMFEVLLAAHDARQAAEAHRPNRYGPNLLKSAL